MMLTVHNLSCGYGGAPVLKDVNIDINTNDIVAVIGPNGAGKTTLLRALSRVLVPSGGSIMLDGQDIRDIQPADFSRTVAVVTQGTLPDEHRVGDYVLMGRIPHYRPLQMSEGPHDAQILRRSLEQTDCLNLANEKLGRISAGQRQLARLARALAQEPKVLLLDEPTSYLDLTHQSIILNLVRGLNRENGLGVVMVMHDLNLAAEFSDRLVLMQEGRVCASGTAEEVIVPKIIDKVYAAHTTIGRNPDSGKPHVFVSARR